MDERAKAKAFAEVFTQLNEENKTRLEDIATGMRIQREIDQKKREDLEKQPAAG